MNLEALCAEVLAITGRDELSPQISSFIKQSTFYEHMREVYTRDLVEYEHVLTTPAAHFSLDVTAAPFIRFRSIYTVFPFDASSKDLANGETGRGPPLVPLQANDLVDDYGVQRTDCYYVAGSSLNIRFRMKLPGVVLVYVQSPDVFGTAFNSWIANEYPYAIVHEAAAKVFGILKNEAMVKLHRTMAQEHRQLLLPYIAESAVR